MVVDDPNRKYFHLGLILDLAGKVVAKFPVLRTGEFSENLATYEAEGKSVVRKFEPGNLVYRDYPGVKGFIDRNAK